MNVKKQQKKYPKMKQIEKIKKKLNHFPNQKCIVKNAAKIASFFIYWLSIRIRR